MREKNALFSNNHHVMTRAFVSVIVVWVHFHGVVMFSVSAACRPANEPVGFISL
jgi:hypothetical protein